MNQMCINKIVTENAIRCFQSISTKHSSSIDSVRACMSNTHRMVNAISRVNSNNKNRQNDYYLFSLVEDEITHNNKTKKQLRKEKQEASKHTNPNAKL